MFLCTIISVTLHNTIYNIGFAFLSMETIRDYEWMLQCIKNLYLIFNISDPDIIITDTNLNIIRAVSHKFHLSTNLLYLWHLNKNVLSYCKKLLEDKESWTEIYKTWNKILYINKKEEFFKR